VCASTNGDLPVTSTPLAKGYTRILVFCSMPACLSPVVSAVSPVQILLRCFLTRYAPSTSQSSIRLRLGICIGRDMLDSTRTWWVGRGISGGSVELKGGATVCLYGVETFTLTVFIYCTSSRTYIIAVLEASYGFDAGCVFVVAN
jgi:hypothetical protein